MRRIVFASLILAVFAPAASFARPAKRDVPDATDCRNKDQVTVVTSAASFSYTDKQEDINPSKEPDRLAVCVTQGGTTVFYFGGDMQSDVPDNDGALGTCGVIIVADQNLARGQNGEDWSRPGPDNNWGTNDDVDC